MMSHDRRPGPKGPAVPPLRTDTLRRQLITILQEETLAAKELSGRLSISEKEVVDHLEHIRKGTKHHLVVTPAHCLKCGFIFKKRERLGKPGRCPECGEGFIEAPRFGIR